MSDTNGQIVEKPVQTVPATGVEIYVKEDGTQSAVPGVLSNSDLPSLPALPSTPVAPALPEQPTTPTLNELSPEQLDAALQKYAGVSLQDVKQARELYQQTVQERAEQEFRQVLNVPDSEYASAKQQVLEVFKAMPPEQQALYDNVTGLQTIWNFVKQQRQSVAPTAATMTQKSDSNPFANSANWNNEFINNMSPEEYQKHVTEIQALYAQGKIR